MRSPAAARALVIAIVTIAITGCASIDLRELPQSLPARVELERTPFFAQQAYQCGPAALAMSLTAMGLPSEPESLAPATFVPGLRGSLQIEMIAAARGRGAVVTPIEPRLSALLAELAAGHPVVVLQNLGLSFAPVWHYAVAVGYDLAAERLFLRSGPLRRQEMSLATFDATWRRAGAWGIVTLAPGALAAAASRSATLESLVAFERSAPPAEALRAWRAAHERWPHDRIVAMATGNAAVAAGELPTARDAFETLARRDDDAAALNNLAVVLDRLGEREAALAAARRAVALGGPHRAAAQATLDELTAGNARRPD